MASNGPRDDFHNRPTQHGDFGVSEQPPTGEIPPSAPPPEGFERAGEVDPFDQEAGPTPWYRKPGMLIAWLVSVVVLIGLIVFGIIQLINGEQTVGHTPKTTTSTTTTTTTSTTPTTTATTTTTSPGSSAEQPPAQQPTQQQPTGGQTQQPSHHHHLPQLPSVITIPGVPNPVTVPPGLR
ncbi:hypothetical protein A5682_01200 [Mycobacterium mantenii]|uniref:Uncharacterized protein n=1 Tax=Mycobacterium mantenii TaxID=560555 RepID=A0A1A2SX15_MYCNT|nr:hypothetical protein A5688_07265 [Mycobacterium mantenii]OBH48215.1 hypothetical protein A5687_15640 [Mycobacterium mantenii]OBH68641.1 hypothetical protein A5682_01200 [Mycobacterium mantenii]OBH77176.1 hypothetical protein A5683_19635 [Mycobacterium mantenii]